MATTMCTRDCLQGDKYNEDEGCEVALAALGEREIMTHHATNTNGTARTIRFARNVISFFFFQTKLSLPRRALFKGLAG